MKKATAILFVLALAFVLAGCGQKAQDAQNKASNAVDAAKGIKGLADLGKAVESGNEQDTNKAMEKLAQMGADFEKTEFEKTESVDAPEKLPKEVIYSGGKIISASDNSTDTTIDTDITIKTLDELAKVKEFYKKALSENSWKTTSQQNTSDGAEFDAKKGENETVNVDIKKNTYSNITEIRVNYYKSIQ